MDEYIIKKDILQMIESTAMWNRSFSVLYEDIEGMKPSDVAPVRHGRWVRENNREKSYIRICSECRKTAYFLGTGCSYKYCPNCGANMQGGENE